MRTVSQFIACTSLATLLLSGCASSPKPPDPVASYVAFLQEHPGANLQGAREKAAIARLEAFLGDFTKEKLERETQIVYAPDARLDDSLKTVYGSKNIQTYFLASLANSEFIKVQFTDVARSHNDYYFRWIMDVRFKKLDRGHTVRTIGITHIRFNEKGQVILHQDYWDATRGLFESVPVIGGGIRWIKGML
ncbi:hypothetical protein BH09VER1_BH09VER1_00770 [soil metagenome]